jgi:glycosyltransferase involved in cell wall biosynthesis
VPLISLVTPVYNPPIEALRSCINSVRKQTFQDWEWCIVDDCSTDPRVLKTLHRAACKDSRIRLFIRKTNGGIVAASQDALDMSTGDFIALLDHDDELHVRALDEMAFQIDKESEVDYLYSDEDKIDDKGNHYDVFRKPDFDPIRLLGQNYCCHLSVFRSSLIDKIGGFRNGFEGSQDYDLILRASEQARKIVHIPKVLYHWRAIPGSAATVPDAKPYALESALSAVKEHVARRGINAEVAQTESGYLSVSPKVSGQKKVSIIIPTRGDKKRVWGVHTCLLANAVESILAVTSYQNYEIVVVQDFVNGNPTNHVKLPLDQKIRIIPYDAPFNFSDKCNTGVKGSDGDIVVLLNDDVQIVDPHWIDTLVAFLEFPDVAMVGPLLLLEDGRIQSAGHTNIPTPHNLGSGESSKSGGLFGQYSISRRVTGVTAACAAIPRSIYEELGGFSVDFPACFNDLDFGYKILESGKHIVWTPMTKLYHFESLTRDPTVQPHEMQMLERRWKRMFGKDQYTRQSA